MSEYDHEPVRGLPGPLPPGEHIIWQGAPDWRQLAASALHIRIAALYFVAIGASALWRQSYTGASWIALIAVVVIGFFLLLAWAVGRTTIYTLTNKRVALRIGVSLNKCVNLPLGEIESADLKLIGAGHGHIALRLKGLPRLGYWLLWPHARSLRMMHPQPMLRAIPDAQSVADQLLQATRAVQAVAPPVAGTAPAPPERIQPPSGAMQGAAA